MQWNTCFTLFFCIIFLFKYVVNIILNCTVPYSFVQYRTVPYSTVPLSTGQDRTGQESQSLFLLFVDGNRCCTLTFSEVDEENVNVEIVGEKEKEAGEKGKKGGKEMEGEGRKDGRFRETHDNDARKNDELEDKVRIKKCNKRFG